MFIIVTKLLLKKYFLKDSTVFLVLCICLCLLCLASQAQVKNDAKKIKAFLAETNYANPLNNNNLAIIKFDGVLSAAEIAVLKPKKQLGNGYFIVDQNSHLPLKKSLVFNQPANMLWKLSEKLLQIINKRQNSDSIIVRLSFNQLNNLPKNLAIKRIDYQNNILTVNISVGNLINLLALPEILYADIIPVAQTEVVINGIDLGVNQIQYARGLYPNINGSGVNISLKEGMYDANDLDLLGKTIPGANVSQEATTHATIMATLALGRGNTFIRGLGVAPEAKLAFSNFANLMPDSLSYFNRLKINIQNHSYGTDIDNNYGIEAAAFDKQIFDADTLMHIFSAGNKGTSTPTSGIYQDITARANLTGNFKQAKNLLVIGGIDRENNTENLSSKGPAYDGRVKPELVAIGEDGTSGAAAITSGSVALFEQLYRQKFNRAAPSALLRAAFINAADDLGTPEVDFIYGFGRLNTAEALKTLDENRVNQYQVSQNQDFTIPLTLPANVAKAKVTLVWNDPPAVVNAAQSLVNGLDLSVENPGGAITLPWVLSSFPNIDSLSLPATRKLDIINTVQQVTLDRPVAGNYTIHVKGNRITQGQNQRFALAYQYDLVNTFAFTNPENNELFFAGEDNYIRWKNTFNSKMGKLSVSYDGGNTWLLIESAVDLSNGFYNWATPNLFTTAWLKMEVEAQNIISKSFIISAPLTLKVGYACSSGLLLHWNPQVGAKNYTVYHLVDQKLQALSTVTDTLIKLDNNPSNDKFFAVAANGDGFTGLKSYTIDYTLQGVGCYIINLFAQQTADNQVKLDLNIGSTQGLTKIIWQKLTSANTFTTLQETDINSKALQYNILDKNPTKGLQTYQVIFQTEAGNVVSDTARVVFLQNDEFSFYPNPVIDNLTVLSGAFESYKLQLFNMLGQKVFEEERTANTTQFNLSKLAAGLYIGVIVKDGKQLNKFKILKN